MKRLDESDLFLVFALMLFMVTIFAVFSYTKNFSRTYDNVKITVVKWEIGMTFLSVCVKF